MAIMVPRSDLEKLSENEYKMCFEIFAATGNWKVLVEWLERWVEFDFGELCFGTLPPA